MVFHSLVLWHMLFHLPVVPFSPIPVFIQNKILFKHPNTEMKLPILSCNPTRSDYPSFPFHCQVISSAFHDLFISVSNWGMGYFFLLWRKNLSLNFHNDVCLFLYQSMYTLLCLDDCHVWLLMTPWTVAFQAPLSMGILQARILEWVAIPSSRGSSQPRDRTQVSHIAGRFFTVWATREACIIHCILQLFIY